MDIADLRDRYVDQIPFVLSELKDPRVEAAWRNGAKHYNKFNPQIKDEVIIVTNTDYTFAGTAPAGILRVYVYGGLTLDTSIDSLVTNWLYRKPILRIEAGQYSVVSVYPWTLDTVDLDEHPLLDDLIRNELIIICANKRRMADLNELPIGFKGDQFHQEAKDEIERLKEEIKEMMPTITE